LPGAPACVSARTVAGASGPPDAEPPPPPEPLAPVPDLCRCGVGEETPLDGRPPEGVGMISRYWFRAGLLNGTTG
jgi:hypothetical protein